MSRCWEDDIFDWIDQQGGHHFTSPANVERILVRGGWEPDLYHSTMRDDLFSWLDSWYYLATKVLPRPATAAPLELIHKKEKNYITLCGKPSDPEHLTTNWGRVTCRDCHEES